MYYGSIKYCDIANGPGCRTSLFVSGCRNNCPGCFNPETHDFHYGSLFTSVVLDEIIRNSKPYFISGLSVLGGEPLDALNVDTVTLICKAFKAEFPDKTVWVYTGYTMEYIKRNLGRYAYLLRYVDTIVDGPFIEAQKDVSLQFRGSRNQRIIDVKEWLESCKGR